MDAIKYFYQRIRVKQILDFFIKARNKEFECIPFLDKNTLVHTPFQELIYQQASKTLKHILNGMCSPYTMYDPPLKSKLCPGKIDHMETFNSYLYNFINKENYPSFNLQICTKITIKEKDAKESTDTSPPLNEGKTPNMTVEKNAKESTVPSPPLNDGNTPNMTEEKTSKDSTNLGRTLNNGSTPNMTDWSPQESTLQYINKLLVKLIAERVVDELDLPVSKLGLQGKLTRQCRAEMNNIILNVKHLSGSSEEKDAEFLKLFENLLKSFKEDFQKNELDIMALSQSLEDVLSNLVK